MPRRGAFDSVSVGYAEAHGVIKPSGPRPTFLHVETLPEYPARTKNRVVNELTRSSNVNIFSCSKGAFVGIDIFERSIGVEEFKNSILFS